ncbi:hypothetical protein ACFBZI_11585 [Moraxella sp. ZJ142]|uniref:hypothetical protein n=1 Tax=Moraxella marmotae TaxID=3344520 RepID=UPI0035D429F3
MTTSRLEILQNSLAKKQAILDSKISNHFDDVRQANGQPLNDKRNGQSTMNRWDRQSSSIRSQLDSIERTQQAIEREQDKIANCEAVKQELPQIILDLLADGKITQWRKYPNRFFVVGVQKARLVVDMKTKKVSHSHLNQVTDKAQFDIFKELYNHINKVNN